MSVVKGKVSALTEEDLHQCYKEIKSYYKEGTMGDTKVRAIRGEIAEILDYPTWDSDCRGSVIPAILLEIADRKYKE